MKWYNNINLKTKFIFTFGIIIIFVFLLGFVGYGTSSFSNKNYNKAMSYNKEVVVKGISIIQDVINLRITAFNHLNKISAENVPLIRQIKN